MRKAWLILALLAITLSLLAACGAKDEEQVVGELSERLDTLQSYKADIQLVLQTGQEPHEYEVEVWHKAPDYYRISLTNKARDITQIILKNDDGVFVLTPHLNKSFRFQSNWPGNQPQVYLYESLIRDILSDSNRQFSIEGDQYVFDTAANYQNKTLKHQRIWLDKDLKPTKVHIMDADFNVLVELHFSNVEFDATFEDDAFDIQRNMQGAGLDALPTMSADEETEEKRSLGTFYPAYEPPNVELVEEEEVNQDGEAKVVLRYAGDYHFTIIQQHAEAKMVHIPQGEPVDLGFAVGVMTDKSLIWTYDGVDFWLTGDLPKEEMVAVAQSMVGQADK
ncbi:outer membrane lipoprotein-sorting protein [Caldalkalibacillus uzonensis]|uniref:Outer membrane lipoprotein-sorting protein n=1 Tax=Caldalkalibacillus uzonensis TaxID=353224 RepID=A0ABU0CVL6_9BACI|nr:outer membrane lipoprotein-sorting protein [Caldalkalibacillus uzonensis]MDQ0340461.1 outer membrane lipoprotein-sorting protein [Caldalkalibacillus uzonensis]